MKVEIGKFKKAQVTTFIIIAIAVVAAIGAYFALRSNMIGIVMPKQFDEVYNYYLSCVNEETLNGARILGQQAGYIENPDFSPGSAYMPFSSQLNFLGTGVPYWYYISGNGVIKEQIPSKEKMQVQLNDFLKERINECDFSGFEEKGFSIEIGNIENVDTEIKNNAINVNVKQRLSFSFENSSWTGESHSKEVKSNLGKFYELALKIYKTQKEKMFLENYGVDVLRLYAPVDGTEITCSPKIWFTREVRGKLMQALEANVPAIKIKGDYYKISKKENEYFVTDIGEKTDANINFMYSMQWPMKMEVWPSEEGVMKAEPVGLQEGMGMLGFCYVPYHFIYDFAYPVLIQIYYNDEMFQFPVVVYINKNKPRTPIEGAESLPDVVPELCKHKNQKIRISTFNTSLGSVESDINFRCFDTTCDIGKTSLKDEEAVLDDYIPQCVNGFIIASAEGYKTKRHIVKSLNENNVQIVLDKKYKLEFEIGKTGSGDYAVVTFVKDNETMTLVYPEQKEIELTEGQYEIKAYVYSSASISVGGSLGQKCVDVPKSGLLGVLGFNEKKCFEMNIPEEVTTYAVSGGGKAKYYIGESELQESRKITINPETFGTPAKPEDLQANYNNIDSSILDIEFR